MKENGKAFRFNKERKQQKLFENLAYFPSYLQHKR